MEVLKKRLKDNYHYIVSALAVAGIALIAFNFNKPPLFQNTDNLILFAQEEIQLEQGVQVSSGDLGSNKEIDIEKDAIISGNLFADKIDLNKNIQINGNISFNKLEAHKDAEILGAQTKPVSLPIANLSGIPDFQTGTQDFQFEGKNSTLASGDYRDLTVEKDSRLTLTGGLYNINKLFLKENSVLIFSVPTILNINKELKGQEHIAILPASNNLKPTDLAINYQGKNEKEGQDKNKQEDQNKKDKDENNKDNKDKNQNKEKEEGFKPVEFGKNSFLNFKLLAPKAEVHVGEDSTVRGQVLAREIKVEKGAVLSRQNVFVKESDPTKIVESQGVKLIVNEIIILMTDSATLNDMQLIAGTIMGRVIGFLPILNMTKIEVAAANITDLNRLINQLKALNSPFVTDVFPNFINQ